MLGMAVWIACCSLSLPRKINGNRESCTVRFGSQDGESAICRAAAVFWPPLIYLILHNSQHFFSFVQYLTFWDKSFSPAMCGWVFSLISSVTSLISAFRSFCNFLPPWSGFALLGECGLLGWEGSCSSCRWCASSPQCPAPLLTSIPRSLLDLNMLMD